MGKTWPLWRNIALCELYLFTSSHEFISSPDVSKLRSSSDHVGYGERKTINVKAVCTLACTQAVGWRVEKTGIRDEVAILNSRGQVWAG